MASSQWVGRKWEAGIASSSGQWGEAGAVWLLQRGGVMCCWTPPPPLPLVHVKGRADVGRAAGCGLEGAGAGLARLETTAPWAVAAAQGLWHATGLLWHAER